MSSRKKKVVHMCRLGHVRTMPLCSNHEMAYFWDCRYFDAIKKKEERWCKRCERRTK